MVKNIFDVRENRDGTDGQVYCTRSLSIEKEEELEKSAEEILEIVDKMQPSWPVIVLEILCTILVVSGINAFFDADISLKEAFARAPMMWIAILAAGVILIVIKIREKKKLKNATQKIEEGESFSQIELAEKAALDELGVPEERYEIDVLMSSYEWKKEKWKKVHKGLFDYINMPFHVYKEENKLCFTDCTQVYEIPVSDIKGMEKIQKKVTIDSWNKEEEIRDKKYKKYKITTNDVVYYIRGYYKMNIDGIWGAYEILVPEYEEEVVGIINAMIAL